MYNRNDPRFRRRLNQISQNLESANENAQANLFTFSENYIKPCFASIGEHLHTCQTQCFPTREERTRRRRRQSRARPELNFDFYDDWEDEENDALLGWDDEQEDDLDALASSPLESPRLSKQQPQFPRRQPIMNYGTRGPPSGPTSSRSKANVRSYDSGHDPTIIPSQSVFGFLSKLPFNIGSKVLRYHPSAADLQVRPGMNAPPEGQTEGEALLEEHRLREETIRSARAARSRQSQGKHGRKRSVTQSSGRTEDSLSSRGDIFPSDEEADAVPLDEEFSMVLDHRTLSSGALSAANESGSSKEDDGHRRSAHATLEPALVTSQGTTRSNSPSHSISSRRARSMLGRNKSRQNISGTASPVPEGGPGPDMHEVSSLSNLNFKAGDTKGPMIEPEKDENQAPMAQEESAAQIPGKTSNDSEVQIAETDDTTQPAEQYPP